MAQLKSTSVTGNLSVTGNVVASQIIKLDGTNTQLLAANGNVYDLTNMTQGLTFNNNNAYAIDTPGWVRAGWLQHTSSNFAHNGYNKICITDENGWIYYRTKKQFIQDLSLSLVYNYKGTKLTLADLKAIASAEIGDVYFILETGDNWACIEKVESATDENYQSYWSNLGKNVDLSGYMTLDTDQTITGTKTFTSINGTNLGSKDHIWNNIHTYSLNLHRGKSDAGGRIYFYNGTSGNNNYTTWVEYMSDTNAKTCPTTGTPSTFGQVTSWARRSLVENNETFGWIWESIAGPSANGNPTAMMSLHANDGTLKVRGTVHAPSFGDANNDVYIRLSDSNEISFATAKGTADNKNNKIYFGYANRLDSLVNDDNYNRVDTYVFGQHRGTSNNSCFRGHIECGTVSLNSTTSGTKATFEYNSTDNCIDVKFT